MRKTLAFIGNTLAMAALWAALAGWLLVVG